ncbi:MAG: type II secretion system F family protein [Gammaproteobacteria bacterium]|nr:type II secretion system F family protein [Gammaproteobacteria bacterium]
MSYFRYKMIRRDGHVLHGIMELPFNAASTAREHFEQRGLTVITTERISEITGRLDEIRNTWLRRQVRREELIEFLRNMGIMLRSGVPILTALEDTTAHSENASLIRVAEDVRLGIETGMHFADAADQHANVFPDTVRRLIRIGEETGNLDRTLMDAADHLDRLNQINTNARKSLIYPTFVFVGILAATSFWVYYVIPGVADLFRNMNVELPAITQFVLAGVAFLEKNLSLMLFLTAAVLIGAWLSIRLIPWVRFRFHKLLTVLPVTGKIVRAHNLAFIAEYFSLFTASGVNILNSLETLQHSIYNEYYKQKIGSIREGLIRGNTLTQEFGRSSVFPGFVVRMINVGELSGNLNEQLQYIAADYRRRLNDIVERIAEITKPVAILLVGAFFVFIIVALFLPIYDLVGKISLRSSY